MTARVALRLEGPINHLRLVWQAAETLLADVPFESHQEESDAHSARYNVLLALQELVTNILRHGYSGDDGSREVELDLAASDECFEFELRDRAQEFDPTNQELDPRREATPDDEMPATEGGYGLVIVKVVLDEMSYERRDGWNVVRGVKHVMEVATTGPNEAT